MAEIHLVLDGGRLELSFPPLIGCQLARSLVFTGMVVHGGGFWSMAVGCRLLCLVLFFVFFVWA